MAALSTATTSHYHAFTCHPFSPSQLGLHPRCGAVAQLGAILHVQRGHDAHYPSPHNPIHLSPRVFEVIHLIHFIPIYRIAMTTSRETLPPRLRSDVPGTFSHDTMTRRVRGILARVFRENEELPPAALDALRALDDELENAVGTPLTPLSDDGGPDVHHWNTVILAEILRNKETWLSAPWIDAEFYL